MRRNVFLSSAVVTLALAVGDHQLMASDRNEPVSANAETGSHVREPIQSTGIRGRIQTEDGSPVSGASISVECVNELCPPIPDLGVISNADGVFFWPLSPGHYRLTVRKDNLVVSKERVIIVEPSKISKVTGRLDFPASGEDGNPGE